MLNQIAGKAYRTTPTLPASCVGPFIMFCWWDRLLTEVTRCCCWAWVTSTWPFNKQFKPKKLLYRQDHNFFLQKKNNIQSLLSSIFCGQKQKIKEQLSFQPVFDHFCFILFPTCNFCQFTPTICCFNRIEFSSETTASQSLKDCFLMKLAFFKTYL